MSLFSSLYIASFYASILTIRPRADLPFELNEDGIESTMATKYVPWNSHWYIVDTMRLYSHFGHFVLTITLLDLMKQGSKQTGADVRIVNVCIYSILS